MIYDPGGRFVSVTDIGAGVALCSMVTVGRELKKSSNEWKTRTEICPLVG